MLRIVKRGYLIIIMSAFFIIASNQVTARTIGLINSEDYSPEASLDLAYDQGDYKPDGGTSDVEAQNFFVGLRLQKTFHRLFQGYLTAGQRISEFGSSDIENGVSYGGGIQSTIHSGETLNYKFVGSYHAHTEDDFDGASATTYQITNDWQGGLLISRHLLDRDDFIPVNQSHAYLGVIYSGRELEITASGSETDFEYARTGGFSLTAGMRFQIEEAINLEVEGEAGSTFGGSGRISLNF